jgi:RNA polymerase sigma factor for flagellar operon FliA
MPVETQTPATAPLDEETLVRQHLPIVQYEVADLRRRLPEHVNVDDLTSAGMAALALAARSYDPAHGVPFGRYAARRISGALLDELRAHDWASRSVRRRARTHAEASAQLSQVLGRPATAEHL